MRVRQKKWVTKNASQYAAILVKREVCRVLLVAPTELRRISFFRAGTES